MSDQRNAIFIGAIGGIISGVIVEIIKITLLDSSSALGRVTSIAALMVAVIVGVAMARYWIIFTEYSSEAEGSREREKVDGLRERLEQGGSAGKIYEVALTRFLNAVDRFFGDDDPAVKTLWPRAFGYRGKAPFWTAPAYDRCLTIALLYPLLAMLIIWTVTGAVGPGERAIGLGVNVKDCRRLAGPVFFLMSGTSFYLFNNVNGWQQKSIFFILGVIFACIFALFYGYIGIAIFYFILAYFMRFKGAGPGALVIIGCVAGASALALVVALSFLFVGGEAAISNIVASDGGALVIIFAFLGMLYMQDTAGTRNKLGREGSFWFMFTWVCLLLCYIAAPWLGVKADWERGRALLLFLGVLTLVNAPFDWLTIGLTRALLRRGLELRRWWPLALALLDLIFAAAIIVALAIAMLLAVQAFEYVGGAPILGVEKVLNDLADPEMRTHPEYWWLYATLFSTLIPSIINVAIGALSIMRGSNWFHRYVAAKMPAGQAMLLTDALWAVPLLALEVLGSVVIGVALTLGWIWVVVAKLFPLFGGLIPMLRAVAGLG